MKTTDNNRYFKLGVAFSDTIVSLLIFATIAVLIIYMVFRLIGVYVNVLNFNVQAILHEMAFLVVFVKAYRLMIFYLESHHVSIKYIMEISIIAPAVEIIFATANQTLGVNLLFGFFSLANLILYLTFYKQLCAADESCETTSP